MPLTPETTTAFAPPPELIETPRPRIVAELSKPVAPTVPIVRRSPRWVLALDEIHRATRSPLAIVTDLIVVAACGIAVGVTAWLAVVLGAAFASALYLGGRYNDRSSLETQGLLWYASRTVMAASFATLAGVASLRWAGVDEGAALRFGAAAAVGLLALRAVTWMILASLRRKGLGLRRTLIVGDSVHARMLVKKLSDYPEAGLLPVAMLPLGNGHGFARFLPEFPNATQLARVIEESSAEHVVLAPDGSDEAILECVKSATNLDVSFSILPPLAEFFMHPAHVAQVGGLPLIPLGKIAQRRTTLPGKRLFDLVGATLMMLAISPVMAFTAIAIKLFDRGPVFYRQSRVGRGGEMFKMLKFRSMVEGAERTIIDLRDQNATNGLLFKVYDDPRVTRVGRTIRRFSIDELPQLWNVVKGEMSLVGPRPLAVRPEDFGPIDDQRHAVTPGITGYWQIAGGNGLTYEEMVKLDLAYIQNWSLWLDVRLLARTVPALVNRRGPW
jgi:exopolysaccharide biosynthesis polyprenyl glycosylphosphotransferase